MSAADPTDDLDAAALAAELARVGIHLRSGEHPDYNREAALLIDASRNNAFAPPLAAP